MKKIKHSILSLALLLGLLAPAALPTVVGAQISQESKDAACEGLGTSGGGGCNGSSGNSVMNLVSTAVEVLSWIIGVVAVIMVIVGGFKFVVSAGDANGVKSARSTIIYALVGLVVAALAQILVRFVLTNV